MAIAQPKKTLPPSIPVRVPPLFRRIDWLSLLITFAVIFVTYMVTLAPELTLEDSGELVTGSMYAGIPHPPGYPVWTIYSWLWTVLLPMGNMAWRVSVGEAFAGATACGILALMVSRGSSMFVEGIEELKSMAGKWENAICLVAGVVAGLLMGLDGFMWRESIVVNRIAVFSVPWFLLMLACLLRWIYAPHQYRFAYLAAFVFGICLTTHQSLIVAAIGFEVALVMGSPRLGRDVLFGNFVVYLIYMLIYLATGRHIAAIISRGGFFILFNLVGLGSFAGSMFLAVRTQRLLTEWKHVVFMFLFWLLGISFYLYMALAGMTNPPMQWGYPRTVEGFWHAISRGQYEQPTPTNLLTDPGRFVDQMRMLVEGVAQEFNWVYILIALVPFFFFFRMQRRERAWLVTLGAMYVFLGALLILLLNPTRDRASADLIRVFLTSSHTVVGCLIGYGLALIAAYMATHYKQFRLWGILGGIVACVVAFWCLYEVTGTTYFGRAGQVPPGQFTHWVGQAFARNQYGLPVFAGLLLVAIALAFVGALVVYRERGPLLITLGLFAAMPLYSALSHWFDSEQHNHMFGYWFGHDMFTPPFKGADGKPIYPEMTKDAVLYGGTDPGRFCPTYIIFCESFTEHKCQPAEDQKFDRRDVYIITQNALADGTYLNYIRAHYNRSQQIDPPFFEELGRELLGDKDFNTNLLARAVSPLDALFTGIGDRVEKRRRTYTSWFVEKDFVDLPALTAKLRPGPAQDPLSKFIYENLRPETRHLLEVPAEEAHLRRNLARDLNQLMDRELQLKKQIAVKQTEKSAIDEALFAGNTSPHKQRRQQELEKQIAELVALGSLYQPERFKHVQVPEYLTEFIKQNPQSHTRIRLNRLLLEAAYPKELAKSLGGVYPDREIYIATPEDSARCFQEYMADAQKRMEVGQLKPGEDVRYDKASGKVSVAGQTAVMNINGLITKVMFDHNPKNEFFVEESFPLDWMYPYLTPFGIIMKINRQPLPDLSEDVLRRDHEFWKQFAATRLNGDIVKEETPIKEITDWIEKTYLRHNFNGYTGDRKFVRDEDAQKAFSKLRSSIAGIYAWRLGPYCTPEYRPKTPAETQRLFREADFAFKQAFAFCPFSPEAVYRYSDLLARFGRVDEAILVSETCLKLDPYNGGVRGLLGNLKSIKAQSSLGPAEEELHKNPSNFPMAVQLAQAYLARQQTGQAMQVLDGVLSSPQLDAPTAAAVASMYYQLQNAPKLEAALQAYVRLDPAKPEGWYDLAGLKAAAGKAVDALADLRKALDLSAARRKLDPKARDLAAEARNETRFAALRPMPEFQKLVTSN
jgi:tetratricopeptide (TPR) repeat protein